MTAVVRFAHAGDHSRLAELDPWPSPSDWVRKIDVGEVLVAEWSGDVVAVLRWERIWTTVPFISLIWVEDAYRGRGISRGLLEFLMDHLRERGAPALLSSAQTNEPVSQSWHEHMGFKRNGVIENVADEGVGEAVYRLLL